MLVASVLGVVLATAPCAAQVGVGDVRRVVVLDAETLELELDRARGWDPALEPWILELDGSVLDRLLERGQPHDWLVSSIVAAPVAHLELEVVRDKAGGRTLARIDLVGSVPAEEVAAPERQDGIARPRLPPARAPDRAIEVRLERLDPTRERAIYEPVDPRPALERIEASSIVKLRCASSPPPSEGSRRCWVAVEHGGRVRLLPTDVSASGRCTAPPIDRRPGGDQQVARSRLVEASSSSLEGNFTQALEQLRGLVEEHPDSDDAVARFMLELARARRHDELHRMGERFLETRAAREQESAAVSLYSWLSFRAGALCARRRGRVEVLTSPEVGAERFEEIARVAHSASLAAERLHLDRAETVVVLLASGQSRPRRVESSSGCVAIEHALDHEGPNDFGVEFLMSRIGASRGPGARGFVTWWAALHGEPRSGLDERGLVTRARELASAEAPVEGRSHVDPVVAALFARRVLERDGPAALARLVRGSAMPEGGVPEDVESLLDHPSSGSIRLQHLGHAAFRITADDGTRLVIDPYGSRWLGLRFPWVPADAVAVTHDHEDHAAIDEVAGPARLLPLSLAAGAPAEQRTEIGPIDVTAFRTEHDRRYGARVNLVLTIEVAGLRIVHLGDVQAPLADELIARLGRVDVLLAPIDDLGHLLRREELDAVVERVRPRVLVPMHYRAPLGAGYDVAGLGGIEGWLEGRERVRRLERDVVELRLAELPREPETWVFWLAPWPEGRLDPIR